MRVYPNTGPLRMRFLNGLQWEHDTRICSRNCTAIDVAFLFPSSGNHQRQPLFQPATKRH